MVTAAVVPYRFWKVGRARNIPDMVKVLLAACLVVTGVPALLLLALMIAVRISRRRFARAIERKMLAKWNLVETRARLDRTRKFIATHDLVPGPPPIVIAICCKKATPCERHRPQ